MGGPAPPWRPPVSLQTGERRPRRLSRGIFGRYTPCGKGLKILLLPPAKELGKPTKRRQRSRKRADFETAARLAAQKGRESQCRNGVAPTISTSPLPFVRVGERVEHTPGVSPLFTLHIFTPVKPERLRLPPSCDGVRSVRQTAVRAAPISELHSHGGACPPMGVWGFRHWHPWGVPEMYEKGYYIWH